MEWLSLMLGGAGNGLLGAALLIGFFWAALAHPDRIRSLAEFRIAVFFLGLSMIVPVIIQLFLVDSPVVRPRQPAFGQEASMKMYWVIVPPLLSMLAVILGVDSVTPRSRAKDA